MENTETLYLKLWDNEEINNDKAQTESFENSQKNEEVLKKQYEEDFNEIELKEKTKNSIVVKCINCIAHN